MEKDLTNNFDDYILDNRRIITSNSSPTKRGRSTEPVSDGGFCISSDDNYLIRKFNVFMAWLNKLLCRAKAAVG